MWVLIFDDGHWIFKKKRSSQELKVFITEHHQLFTARLLILSASWPSEHSHNTSPMLGSGYAITPLMTQNKRMSPKKGVIPKRKGSSSNHQSRGAMLCNHHLLRTLRLEHMVAPLPRLADVATRPTPWLGKTKDFWKKEVTLREPGW